jgi:glycolate oxidase FAD binding subunit
MARIVVQSEADVVEAVRAARAKKATIEIISGGTKHSYGRPVDAHDVLDVSALAGVVNYEPDELVITARAATTIAEIEDALAPRAQRLGFDPADWGPLFGTGPNAATIGGVLSADACGSARVQYGGARDHLLGYRAVNGLAESYKAGGHVVKNVTGFDLPKLMCGAMGTLGALTEVTLRLVPRAPLSVTLIARDIASAAGFALLRRVWTSAFGSTGLSYIPGGTATSFPALGMIGAGAALIRLEGTPVPLDEKIAGVKALAPSIVLDDFEGERIFRDIGDGRAFVGNTLDVWRVALPPHAAAQCAAQIGSELWLGDWAGGLLWIGAVSDDEVAAHSLRAAASSLGGHATLMRACANMRSRVPVFQPDSPALTALNKSVKAAFDPLGIFNPGRMFEGI